MMPVMRNQNWLPSLFNDFFGSDTPIFRLRQVICRHRFTLEQQDKTQEP